MKAVFFTMNDKLRILVRFVLAAGFILLAFYQFNSVSNRIFTLKVIAFAIVGIVYLIYGLAAFRGRRK